jgi:hypothetical protein
MDLLAQPAFGADGKGITDEQHADLRVLTMAVRFFATVSASNAPAGLDLGTFLRLARQIAATNPHRPQPSAPLSIAQRPAGPAKQCRDPSRGQQAIGDWRVRRPVGVLAGGSTVELEIICI